MKEKKGVAVPHNRIERSSAWGRLRLDQHWNPAHNRLKRKHQLAIANYVQHRSRSLLLMTWLPVSIFGNRVYTLDQIVSTHQDAGSVETSLGLWHPSGCGGWHSGFSCKSFHQIRGCCYWDIAKEVLCHQLETIPSQKFKTFPFIQGTSEETRILFGQRACTSLHHSNRCSWRAILTGKMDGSMRLVY